jgi:hypothetical protein
LLQTQDLFRLLESRLSSQINNLKGKSSPDEQSYDIQRKRNKRSSECEIKLREPKNPQRRERCLADPELFLKSYFGRIFYNPFAEHHKRMIEAIHDRAFTGGDKAIAAPRGDGKSQIAICMVPYCFHATPIDFPVIIGQTSPKARKMFAQVKSKYENREKYKDFCDDFPEVSDPVAALRGAPQRAAHQWYWHNGEQLLLNLQWKQDIIVLPSIETEWTNRASGNRLVYFGLDGAIRGEGFEEMRPHMAIVDDPETREIAFSPTNRYEDIEEMIDGDVAGLAGPDRVLARVVLTTIQNSYCYSAKVTDPKRKPSFEGERHGWLKQYPDKMDLWEEYISLRHKDKYEGFRNSPNATAFYIARMEEMQEGCIVNNPHRFISALDDEGKPLELDAIQAFFNRVADYGWPRVLAEYQNDPEKEEEAETTGINEGLICSRMSGRIHKELPTAEHKIALGVDVGKYKLDFVKIAFEGNAVGTIVDYGEWKVTGTDKQSSEENVLKAILRALRELRMYAMADSPPDIAFVDSGDFTQAIYAFAKEAGHPWHPVKGSDTGRMKFTGEDSKSQRFYENVRSDADVTNNIWLFHVNGPYWKEQVHQRFITQTFDESHQFNDGSLSLWSTNDIKQHAAFAKQIVAEILTVKDGKKVWIPVSRDNHKLDATGYALAGAGCLGVRVIPKQIKMAPKPKQEPRKTFTNQFGQPFLATERRYD